MSALSTQPRYHQEVIRSLGIHKLPFALNDKQKNLLLALSTLESLKEGFKISKKKTKTAQASKPQQQYPLPSTPLQQKPLPSNPIQQMPLPSNPIQQKPSPEVPVVLPAKPDFQIAEAVFTHGLEVAQADVISLWNEVDSLKQDRDQIVHKLAKKNIQSANSDPRTKRYNFYADHDPLKEAQSFYAGTVGEVVKRLNSDAEEKCEYEKEELSLFAGKYKDSETIQDMAELIKIRMSQKLLLEQEKYMLKGEIAQSLSLLI